MHKYLFALLLLTSVCVHSAEIPTETVVLRGVDKITGRVSTMQASVGKQISFGHLTISVEKCFTRPPEETPENSAFLVVSEKKIDGTNVDIFTGWMFSSNPALSAMEHPGYDIWVIACKQNEKTVEKTLSELVEAPVLQTDEMQSIDENDGMLSED
ncbi:MAG: DUF2155 domain-containing protein [Alphaproteobacteria bacterium]|nr:DUF2155 domain-containing protein [Alphaproteobacteria bacterium]